MEEGMEKKEKEKRIRWMELVLLFAMTSIEWRESRILDSTVFIFRATFTLRSIRRRMIERDG